MGNLASVMATVRKIISTSKAPGPIAAYNQAVVANNMLYISGQMGLDPETKKFVSDDAGEQTRQTLNNIGTLLKLGGSSFDKVVKVTVLLQDINDFKAVNDVYKTFFTKKQPARAAYQAKNLPIAGGKVEIEAIAIVGDVID